MKGVLFASLAGAEQFLKLNLLSDFSALVVPATRDLEVDAGKKIAEDHGIKFFIQPRYSNKEAFVSLVDNLKSLEPEFVFSNCYSMLIRPEILSLTPGRAYNCHWALLPENKGPNPGQWSLIKGQEKTGVTIHQMDEGFDTGRIAFQKEVEIDIEDTWITLADKLEVASRNLIKEKWQSLISGKLKLKEQMSEGSYNERLNADSPKINFETMSDLEVYNLIRAQVAPLSGAYYFEKGEKVHIQEKISLEEIASLRERLKK